MRRGGFTMIELIFVIVILGILAAVALPKFIGVSEQAKVGNIKAFVGTLNRTVGPTLWSEALSKGYDGNISKLNNTMDKTYLQKYTDIPDSVVAVDLTKCDDSTVYKTVMQTSEANLGDKYAIMCEGGSPTVSPRFALFKTNAAKNMGESNTTNDECIVGCQE